MALIRLEKQCLGVFRGFFVVFSWLFRGFFVALILGKFYAYSPWKSLLNAYIINRVALQGVSQLQCRESRYTATLSFLAGGQGRNSRNSWALCGRLANGYFGNGYFEFQCEERLIRRRTNVQQLTCNIDLSRSFYYLFFSFVLLELKPFVLKGRVLEEKFLKKCEKVRKSVKNSETILPFSCCPLIFL